MGKIKIAENAWFSAIFLVLRLLLVIRPRLLLRGLYYWIADIYNCCFGGKVPRDCTTFWMFKNYPKWQHFCECNIPAMDLIKFNQTVSIFTVFNTREVSFLYVKTLLFAIRFQILSVIGSGRRSGGECDGRSVRNIGHFRYRPNFPNMAIIGILIELSIFLSDCKGVPKSVPKGGGKSVPNHDWRSACKGDYISGRIMNISAKWYVCKRVSDIKTP